MKNKRAKLILVKVLGTTLTCNNTKIDQATTNKTAGVSIYINFSIMLREIIVALKF